MLIDDDPITQLKNWEDEVYREYITSPLVLQHNYISIDTLPTIDNPEISTTYFKYLLGIPMGTPCAGAIANIFAYMRIERPAFAILKRNKIAILSYFRLIDDIHLITNCMEHATTVTDVFNDMNEHMKFTATHDMQASNFLDVTVYKSHDFHISNTLSTCVYFKPTARFQFPHASTALPAHILKNVVISEIGRLSKLCSNDRDFYMFKHIWHNAFIRREYNSELLKPFNGPFPSRREMLFKEDRGERVQPEIPYLILPHCSFTQKRKREIRDIVNPPQHIREKYPHLYTEGKTSISYSTGNSILKDK